MSISNYLSDKYQDFKDNLKFHYKHSNIITILTSVVNYIHNMERGTEYPEYFPYASQAAKCLVDSSILHFANFIRIHEPEINIKGKKDWSYYKRIEYFLKHFHIYQNETMRNLYFLRKIQQTQMDKLNYNYNVFHFSWLFYNCVSGTALVAITGYLFKNKNYGKHFGGRFTNAFVASVPLFAALWLNYQVSEGVKIVLVNNHVRRLGHGDLVCRKFERYPKNIEFVRY